ncbi:MAG: PIN domain nuclease [Candidatus Subteraquimicrobiales bacterium]|nr:PIN domain nuclease [Candidatus Subteraquimicrobiales bacterium]
MILVDTSVWIDFLKGAGSKHHLALHLLIEEEEDICIADIILTEILQGIKSDKDSKQAKNYLFGFPIYSLKDVSSYVEAAQIYRVCRKKGLTIRRPLDCIIARIAIENDLVLFHNDRDFDTIAEVVRELQIYSL